MPIDDALFDRDETFIHPMAATLVTAVASFAASPSRPRVPVLRVLRHAADRRRSICRVPKS
jgi:hypothetical protein